MAVKFRCKASGGVYSFDGADIESMRKEEHYEEVLDHAPQIEDAAKGEVVVAIEPITAKEFRKMVAPKKKPGRPKKKVAQ